MIDHVGFEVADLERSGRFYDVLLATIGAVRRFEKPDFICYGTASAEFPQTSAGDQPVTPTALTARSALRAAGASADRGFRAGRHGGGAAARYRDGSA